MTSLSFHTWGYLPTGEPITRFRLTNGTAAYVEFTNLGATWVSAVVPDASGTPADVLLGYDSAEGYLRDPYYMGATIGPFANRIANAAFLIEAEAFLLEKNDGENTNHGGSHGFHQKLWKWTAITDGIRFSLHVPDGEGGYPGNRDISVAYLWDHTNTLTISHQGSTDHPTWLNLTNHAYFNLTGTPVAIAGHHLCIPANRLLETTPAFIPTGRYLQATGSVFDFTTPHPVADHLYSNDECIRQNRGYNHCYILKETTDTRLLPAAWLSDPISHRSLLVETTLPGILLYTAGYLEETITGKGGLPFAPHAGLCLETQFFPDTPHHPHFPSCLLQPGESYNHQTLFHFNHPPVMP